MYEKLNDLKIKGKINESVDKIKYRIRKPKVIS